MAINITAPNFPGMPGVGNANVTVPGALGLQAAQLTLNDQESRRNAAIAQAQMRQQAMQSMGAQRLQAGQQNLQAQQLQYQQEQDRRQGLLAQQTAQQLVAQNQVENQYKQDALAQARSLGQGQIDADNRKTAYGQMVEQIKLLAEKKKEDLNNMGAFAAQAQVALNAETDPTKANLLRNELTDQAVSLGIIQQEQAKQFKQLPLSQFKQATGLLVFQTDKAKEIQAMSKGNVGDMSLTVGADGSLSYTSSATDANKTKSQEEYVSAKSGLAELEPYLNPPENMFGLAAAKHDVTYLRELGKSIGLGADEKDVSEMALYNKYNANSKLQIMQTAKTLAGARFSDADLKMIEQIMPQVGKSQTKAEYMAKADLVKSFLERSAATRAEILSTGKYKIGTEEYDKAFSDRLPGIMSEITKSKEPKILKYNPATRTLE